MPWDYQSLPFCHGVIPSPGLALHLWLRRAGGRVQECPWGLRPRGLFGVFPGSRVCSYFPLLFFISPQAYPSCS